MLRYKHVILFLIFVGLPIVACVSIEYANNKMCKGGLIQSYHEISKGLGSGKWRGAGHQKFKRNLLYVGLPVYPLSLIGIILSISAALNMEKLSDRRLAVFSAIILAGILIRFFVLGVATTAVGLS